MEIRIDTSKDSVQDIRKAIEFLSKFVEHREPTAQTFDMPASVNMGSIFGDAQETPKAKDVFKDDEYKIIPY